MSITNIENKEYQKLYESIDKSYVIQLFQKFKLYTIFPVLLWTKKDEACIDIGCAKGNFLKLLKSYGYTRLTGLDIEDCLYKELRNKIIFFKQSICTQVFDIPKEFDNVIVQNTIHHLPVNSLEIVADNLVSLLKKNGKIFIYEPNMDSTIGRLFYFYFLKLFFPALYEATMKEKKEQLEFCKAWPKFIKKIKTSGIEPIKESNISFYKIFIGRKRA